jgi:hypothetical protein
MTPSGRLSVVVAALVVLGGSSVGAGAADAGTEPLSLRSAGSYHQVPASFAGFNAPFRRNSWQAASPRLHQAAAALRPGAIRIFGGTTANYWDWRTGRFVDRPGVPPRLRRVSRDMEPIHLSDWATLADDAHAIPVFDLNLVTSSLSSQLDMLRAAKRLGMPIRRIELGNELYFPAPLVAKAIPSARAYGRKATRWIEAIKARFPRARFAAAGVGYSADPQEHGERLASWDRQVRHTLSGEDALAFHTYWIPPQIRRLGGAKLSAALAAPIQRLRTLRSQGLGRLPDGVDAWVTEWNVWHRADLRGTWANGLGDAAFLLGLLAEPSVGQEDLHPLVHPQPLAALFGNPHGFRDGPGTVRYAPTAVGEAVGRLYPMLWGGARVRRLVAPGGPRISGTRIPAVRGIALQGRGALLVNMTSKRRAFDLPADLACVGTVDSVWARPSARITGKPGTVRRATSPAAGSLVLPAFSVSRMSC